jgi:hypothetical protein
MDMGPKETESPATGFAPKFHQRLILYASALSFRPHTCKDVTATGPVRGKQAACSALTRPACSIWGEMGCSVRDFSHPRRAKIERNSWGGKGIDFQRNRSNQEAKKEKKINFF